MNNLHILFNLMRRISFNPGSRLVKRKYLNSKPDAKSLPGVEVLIGSAHEND